MTIDDLIAYYQALLIIQYATQPNALATIGLMIGEFLQNQILDQVNNAFDVKTAVGAQLDVLGEYVGLSRDIYGINANKKFFGMPSYAAPTLPVVGFNLYADPPNGGFFFLYSDENSIVYVMTDGEYSQLIQFVAKGRSMSVTEKTLDDLVEEFFGTTVGYEDELNMSAIFIEPVIDVSTLFPTAWAAGAIPRPAGVVYNLIRAASTSLFCMPSYASPTPVNAFGFGTYTDPTEGGSIARYP